MFVDQSKWCEHCNKAGHTDVECWCTRVVPPPTQRLRPLRPVEFKPSPMSEALAKVFRP